MDITNCGPLVSVIVPAHNCAAYLPAALDSILTQQYPNLEVIVVDDGSSDGSAEIAERYGPPVKVVRQKNQGPAAARNRGATEAQGQYLAFLDGDDLWLPGKLVAQMKHLLAHPEIGIVYGGFQCWHANKDGTYPPPECFFPDRQRDGLDMGLSGWIYHRQLLDSYICIITAVIPRRLFETLGGFDESLRVGEDYDFWLRASQIVPAHKLSRNVSLYRANPASTTHILRPVNNEQVVLLRAVEKYGLASPDGAAITSAQLEDRLFKLAFGHGYMHFWGGSPCVALVAFRDALGHKRKRLRTVAYLLLAYVRCALFGGKAAPIDK